MRIAAVVVSAADSDRPDIPRQVGSCQHCRAISRHDSGRPPTPDRDGILHRTATRLMSHCGGAGRKLFALSHTCWRALGRGGNGTSEEPRFGIL